MKKKHLIVFKIRIITFLIFSTILYSNKAISQCAGASNSVTICDKELDPNLQNYDLFNQLGGVPQTGGRWTSDDPINQQILNNSTGIVNLWAINRYGSHSFTYTNSICNESATVTIYLGGYAGEDNIDGGANACSDDIAVDLFSFLDNDLTNLGADINGQWREDTTSISGFLVGNFFNANAAGVGTYTFTYTVDGVNTCASEFSTVILEVHRAPISGEPDDITICENDDFSLYTDVDLFNQLTGEDTNGIWIDASGTGQITDAYDSTINIEEVYTNFGPGKYVYTYTVYPTHGVCPPYSTSVRIFIAESLDYSGQFSVSNHCLNEPLYISIPYTNSLGLTTEITTHDLEYEIRNTDTNELIYSDTVTDLRISNNLSSFQINPSPITDVGNYTITATNISNISSSCATINISGASFGVVNSQASINQMCFEGNDALIQIDNLSDANGGLSNETIIINYIIRDLTNGGSKIIRDYEITFNNGSATLPIDISTFPENATSFNLTITEPINSGLGCIDFNFSADLVPENIQLELSIDNQCNATNVEVIVDAPALSNGQYTVTYEVREVGNPTLLADLQVVFVGGQITNQVDISNLEPGNYEIILKSIQNDTHPCRTQFEFEISDNFSIDGIPDPPTLDTNQTFCFSDYEPNGPTIANIVVNSGENLTWYEDETSTTPLDPTTLLVDKEDYYVAATDPNNNCQSSDRSVVVVSVITTTTVTSPNINPVFCASDNATLADLEATTNGGTLIWYDSNSDGNLLDSTTPLVDRTSYYAVESIGICESAFRLQFNVTVVNPPIPKIIGSNLLCALDNLTILDLERTDLGGIISTDDLFELIWYDSQEGGLELDTSELLQEGVIYYVASIDPESGCESDRIEVSVILSECDPANYDFFIPDGFSPNNDGMNDNYYIPNIQFFYPNYELEIFNRYGQSLFKGDINRPAWDGTNNRSGNDTTSGVYFYILKYNKNNLKPKQGRIYLSK